MAAVAATPSITIPIGETRGLPLGLTIMGPAYGEGELLAFGYAIEQATKARKAPQVQTDSALMTGRAPGYRCWARPHSWIPVCLIQRSIGSRAALSPFRSCFDSTTVR